MLLKNSNSIKIIGLITLASFFYACSPEGAPEDLIPKELMMDLLSETHLIESQVGRMSLNSYDSAHVAFGYLQKELWEKNDVDSAQYVASFEYYARYPKVFGAMYDQVEQHLKDQEDEEAGEPIERYNRP